VNREIVVWDDSTVDEGSLNQLNMTVRRGRLANLGVSAEAGEAESGRFAVAVALALTAMREGEPAVDFLHSRLAPAKKALVPRWAVLAALAVLVVIGGSVYAYSDLQRQEADLATLQQKKNAQSAQVKTAEAFVSQVEFAKGWHSKDTRYLNCLRDLTAAFPDDGQTYATNFTVKEATQTAGGRTAATGVLSGTLFGKTGDQQRVQAVLEQIQRKPGFRDVKSGGTQEVGRAREVSFSITFSYFPDDAARALAAAKSDAGK
jgi:hypothetical protein